MRTNISSNWRQSSANMKVCPPRSNSFAPIVMNRQLDDVVAAFNKFAASQLPSISSKLKAKHLPPFDIKASA